MGLFGVAKKELRDFIKICEWGPWVVIGDLVFWGAVQAIPIKKIKPVFDKNFDISWVQIF